MTPSPGPKAQENEFPLEGSCQCLKPKNLASPHYATNAKHHKHNVRSFGLLETVRQAFVDSLRIAWMEYVKSS